MDNNFKLATTILIIMLVVVIIGEGIKALFNWMVKEKEDEASHWRKLPKDNETVRDAVRMREKVLARRGNQNSTVPTVPNSEPHKVDIEKY